MAKKEFNGHDVWLRDVPSSDLSVYRQVIEKKEYAPACNEVGKDANCIIDLGGNIGLSSIFFSKSYPKATIACVEPDEDNVAILKANIRGYPNVKLFKNGIYHSDGVPLKVVSDFRDRKEWARRTIEADYSVLKSITVPPIMKECGFDYVDLLKIDIEGGEIFLLDGRTDVSFLDKTRVIAMEIHDEFNCRSEILTMLTNFGFTYKDYGQTTVFKNGSFTKLNKK